MSYYSISAILTSAQKVPCTFDLPIPNLGFLDDNPGGDVRLPIPIKINPTPQTNPSKSPHQIPPHTPISLPLYLAELLAVQQLDSRPLLTLDLPASLGPRVLNALKADAKSVDLRALDVYFFEGASRVLELLEEEGVGDVVSEVGCVFSLVLVWLRGKEGEGGKEGAD